jgi:uncharacterized protein YbjT (DUF2867 family)
MDYIINIDSTNDAPDHRVSVRREGRVESNGRIVVKILVVGGSKGTGARVVERALAAGHDVSAFSRSPERNGATHPRLRKIAGSFHDEVAVDGAVADHDAVIITASANSRKEFRAQPQYFSLGTAHVVRSMRARGARRLVVLSSLGVGESRSLLPLPARLLLADLVLKPAFVDHEVQERMVRASGLDWVIARPSRLTDGPGRGEYRKASDIVPVPSTISRDDVADFLLEASTTPSWIGQAVHLGG